LSLDRPDRFRRRYLEAETGTLVKTGHCPLEVGLVALSPYETAMSSLGGQTVYRLFNELEGARCERLVRFDRPRSGAIWVSLESGRAAAEFPVLAFSISYEQEMLELVRFLQENRITPRSADRGEGDPLLLAGGPVVSSNPEPVAPFLDVCGIGDAEILVPSLAANWLAAYGAGWTRRLLLETLAGQEGFYVPGLYRLDGVSGSYPVLPRPAGQAVPVRVGRATADVGRSPAFSVIVSRLAHFRDMHLVEVARGCRWNCRFCLVCRINRPYRPAETGRVIELIEAAPAAAGAIGLVGANLCDHPELARIAAAVAASGRRLGTSSLRVGSVDRELLTVLKRCRVESLTLAPETASAELLARIGKSYRQEELFETVRLAAEAGFRGLKLYYMIGLPGETAKHRRELVEQVRLLAGTTGNRLRLKISVNPFIPKPQTAWQDESMLRPGEIKRLLRELRKGIRQDAPGVQLQHDPPAEAVSQAALSLGDRSFAQPLEMAAAGAGHLLDCLGRSGIDLEPVLYSRKKPAAEHPWSVLESGFSR